MTVYLEYVLADNLLADYLIILVTARILGASFGKFRILLSVLFGTACAFLLLFLENKLNPTAETYVVPAYKCAVCVVMPAVFFEKIKKLGGFTSYLLTLGAFVTVTFAFGGAVFALEEFLGLPLSNGGILGALCGAVLLFCYILRQLRRLVERNRRSGQAKAVVYSDTESITADALWDSGNSLTYGEKPVVVVSGAVARRINLEKNGCVSVRTVNGTSELPLFSLKKLEISCENGVECFDEVAAAVADDSLGDFDIILNCALRGKK